MSALQKFKTFFSKNVLLCLTVPMVVFSLLVPQPFVWMGQNISIDLSGVPFLKENFPSFGFVNMLLCVIMFGMGMTLKADDFKYILKKPTDVLIGICSQYVFMAGFGWLVASLLSLTGVGDPTVRAQIAVGLVLLGGVLVLSMAFGLDHTQYVTLLPKSITTAIGMGLSEELGGMVSVTVASIIVTGLFGNVAAAAIFKLFRIKHPVAIGVSCGTGAHAMGTSRAREFGEIEEAMSGLSIAVCGLLTVVGASIFAMIRF